MKKFSQNLSATPFPKTVSVQLATLVDIPPEGDAWLHEVKFDGYRIVALKQNKQVTLLSRNHKDWTDSFPNIVAAIKKLPVKNAVFDGEIVLLNEKKLSDFQLLQNTVKAEKEAPFIYYIFDLLYLDKYNLENLPLIERKQFLAPLLRKASRNLRYSDHQIANGMKIFKQGCKLGLEGIVSKRVDSPYVGKRTQAWLKEKCSKRQEFIIVGFSPPGGSRKYFGALYLGVFNKQHQLVYAGKVGTGFTEASLKSIHQQLKKIISKQSPFAIVPKQTKDAVWLKPKLIGEVEFTEWTKDGRLRHPSFKGLRMDKKPKEIIKEKAQAVDNVKTKQSIITLTHPEKILYPEDRISKQQLYDYYVEISDFILPYISNRPLTLVRCPNNYKKCFYQKNMHELTLQGLHAVPIKGKDDAQREYLYVNDLAGLLSLVQMAVLEIHPWGSTIEHLAHPDIMIFDVDPALDVPWKKVVAAAFTIKKLLMDYQLTSFVKTTGGKGLHVVVPIAPNRRWQTVKNFTHALVLELEQKYPDLYCSKMSKELRKGKIFIDYLRNQQEATAVGPYSTRARLHAPVATPLHWDELTDNIKDTYFTIKTLPKRLEELKKDPWEKFFAIKQMLEVKK